MNDADVLLLMEVWQFTKRVKDKPEEIGYVTAIHLTQVEWRLREALRHLGEEFMVSPKMQTLIDVALYPPHLRKE